MQNRDTVTDTGPGIPLWLVILIAGLLLLNGLPFLAPVFMKLGWEGPARAVYLLYSGLCHQMAQRSFFLFGSQGFQMYRLDQIPVDISEMSLGQSMLALRAFTGSEELGWKVAWSDRMVYMYFTPLLVALAYGVLRRRREMKPLSLVAFGLLLLPMLIDGGTHMLSDIPGLAEGFRYHNTWLARLTGYAFSTSFYAGDAFGSFNSWMRLLSGITFGIAVGGLSFPIIDDALRRSEPQPAHDTIAVDQPA